MVPMIPQAFFKLCKKGGFKACLLHNWSLGGEPCLNAALCMSMREKQEDKCAELVMTASYEASSTLGLGTRLENAESYIDQVRKAQLNKTTALPGRSALLHFVKQW